MRSKLDFMFAATLVAMAEPALALHMDGTAAPTTLFQGLLAGLREPVLGVDHFAAVVAAGFVAAAHGGGLRLIAGFVMAAFIGIGLHILGVNIAASGVLLAVAVIVLGAAIQLMPGIGDNTALSLFATAGLINGYALGNAIAGAQPDALFAFLAASAVIQIAIAFAAMNLANVIARETFTPMPMKLRLVSGAIVGIGLVLLFQNLRTMA